MNFKQILGQKPSVVIMTPEQAAEVERLRQETAEKLRLEQKAQEEQEELRKQEFARVEAEKVKEKATAEFRSLLLDHETKLGDKVWQLRKLGRPTLADALSKHTENLSPEKSGAEELLQRAEYMLDSDWKKLRLFTEERELYASLCEKISKLVKSRDEELCEMHEDVSNSGKYEIKPSELRYKDFQRTVVTPETLSQLRAVIIAKYDPQILELCKERAAVENYMTGMYKAVRYVRGNNRTLTQEQYKRVTHEVRKSQYEYRKEQEEQRKQNEEAAKKTATQE